MGASGRNLLHKNKINQFKEWLLKNGWEIQETKGFYEVLRAKHKDVKGPLIIYAKNDSKEHYIVMRKHFSIVKAFIRQSR